MFEATYRVDPANDDDGERLGRLAEGSSRPLHPGRVPIGHIDGVGAARSR